MHISRSPLSTTSTPEGAPVASVSDDCRVLSNETYNHSSVVDVQINEDEHLPKHKKYKRLEDDIELNEKILKIPKTQEIPTKIASYAFDLSNYRWDGVIPRYKGSVMFPINFFGDYMLQRKRIIDLVFEIIEKQKQDIGYLNSGQSININGCSGMGRTSNLFLIGKALIGQGYEVYSFYGLSCLNSPSSEIAVKNLLKDYTKKIAFLIDGIRDNYDSSTIKTMLTGYYPHLVTIGVTTGDEETDITSKFHESIEVSDLVLKETDDDYLELINTLNKGNEKHISEICSYILNHCGGHVFPTLFFIEQFVSNVDNRIRFNTFDAFINHFHSFEFVQSDAYKIVKKRCFRMTSDMMAKVTKVLLYKYENIDIKALEKVGWYKRETNSFISAFLKNIALQHEILSFKSQAVSIDPIKHYDNVVLAIVTGFYSLKPKDLTSCNNDRIRIENSLSINWSLGVLKHIKNVSMWFQQKSQKEGFVDYYFNGHLKFFIKFVRDAKCTEYKDGYNISPDIDNHINTFKSGKYPWENFYIVNISFDDESTPALSSDSQYHDRIFNFIYPSNDLYRGKKEVCRPAVFSLSSNSSSLRPIYFTSLGSHTFR